MAVTITQTANPNGVAASSTIATYTDISIGEAASNRIIAVVVGTELANSTPSVCTIDSGGGAVSMTAGTTGTFGNMFARIFYLLVPTGTTATIAVKFSNVSPGATANHIAVYRILDALTTLSAEGGDGSTDMDASDPLTTNGVTIAEGGGFIAVAAGATDNKTKTWANATEDLDIDAGTFQFTTAIRETSGTVTITCTGSTNGEDGAMSWLIFTAEPIERRIFFTHI